MKYDYEFTFDVAVLKGGLNFGRGSLDLFFVYFCEFTGNKNDAIWAEVLFDFTH